MRPCLLSPMIANRRNLGLLCPTDLRPLDNYLLSLILSAVDSLSNLQSCLCQYVKELFPDEK